MTENYDSAELYSQLRKVIHSQFTIDTPALNKLLLIFKPRYLKANEFFTQGNEYAKHLAFLNQGIIKSYFQDLRLYEIIKGIHGPNEFVIPLPGFVIRQPNFMIYQSVTDSLILQAEYYQIEDLMKKYVGIKKFMQHIIDNEWIIKKHNHEMGEQLYHPVTRLNQLFIKFKNELDCIPIKTISSYLNLPESLVIKWKANNTQTKV